MTEARRAKLQNIGLTLPDQPLTNVHFELPAEHGTLEVTGLPWPFEESSDMVQETYDELKGLLSSRSFDIVLVSHVEGNLREMAERFAKDGYTVPLYEWYWNSKPRYVQNHF